VDSLFLFFLLAGIYAFDSPWALVRSVASPSLMFLAFFTKQPALVVAVGLSVAALLTRKRYERLAFPLVFSVLFLGSSFAMHISTSGWYEYYVFDLPRQHAIATEFLVQFWTKDILQHMAIALCFCFVPLLEISEEHPSAGRVLQDILIFGSLFLAAYLGRIHVGGSENVLMPVHAGIAIYFGVGFAWALKNLGRHPRGEVALMMVAMLQFMTLFYWPQNHVPSAAARQEGERLLKRIASFEGEVYCAAHPWYLQVLGRPGQAQEAALADVFRGSGSEKWKQLLMPEWDKRVAEGRYEALVLDYEASPQMPGFAARYQLMDAHLTGDAFRRATFGGRTPRYLYVRRPTHISTPADETQR
jgi:hypothetical protein